MGQSVDTRRGVAAIVLACAIWGFSPIFYKLVDHIPAGDVLAHRTLWSLFFFSLLLLMQGRLGEVSQALRRRDKVGWIAVASLMIAINWFLFIYAIQIERVTQTSLGYYISPLVSVVLGAVLFREFLGRAQWLAVGLAAVAVGVLTAGLGSLPWISLTLAITFAIYGAIKKQMSDGPVVTVTAEVALLAPFALAWLAWRSGGLPDMPSLVLLMISGPLTAVPLILFSYASRRIRLSTVGLLQYINPSIQFLCAVLIFGESWTVYHAIAFPLIWTALALYSLASMRRASG